MFYPEPGGPGYLSLFGTSFLTCPAWEVLPVAALLPAEFLRSLNYMNFTVIANTYVYTKASSFTRFFTPS